MPHAEDRLGQSIPADTPHAVSVTLPTWRSNVGYEEGQDWVVSRLTTGYPRFFINKIISAFADLLIQRHGQQGELAMLFPTSSAAHQCVTFLYSHGQPNTTSKSRVLDFVGVAGKAGDAFGPLFNFSAVFFPSSCFKTAKTFWQHSGEGVSSRRAEYCRQMYERGYIVIETYADGAPTLKRGPKRYRKTDSSGPSTPLADPTPNPVDSHTTLEVTDQARFLEERFGRNMNIERANDAKEAIRRRIAGSLTSDLDLDKALQQDDDGTCMRKVPDFSPADVYLYPCGMNAIYSTHLRLLAANQTTPRRAVCFGFPYIDTLKVLEKFGPGCLFYGNGSPDDLDDLESRLQNGERFSSLFCEFPSNPLLRTPDLSRIRCLADRYGFAVIVDETIGNFLNVSVLPLADVMVSSLTKIFSGDSNVMGGCAIFNPQSSHYSHLINAIPYEDCYWPEDAIVMERNSRDFVSRIARINVNAEAICELLHGHPRVKDVFYPKINPSRPLYDDRRNKNGRYGGLLSAVFYSTDDAAAFYDNLDTEKGPSLGTNFTLASPFVLLAHYTELDWAAQFGVDKNLIRFSVGLEDTATLRCIVQKALDAL